MSQQPLSPAAQAALDAGLASAIEDVRTGLPLQAWDLDAHVIPRRPFVPWLLALILCVASPLAALAWELTR